MSTIRRFEEIVAWQRARELVRAIYGVCETSRLRADFGLKRQMCRAAVSVMSNIAEGFARKTNNDFAHFLDMSRGSALEVQSLLYVALDVDYIAQDVFDRLYQQTNETAALIGGFTSYLRKKRCAEPPNKGPIEKDY